MTHGERSDALPDYADLFNQLPLGLIVLDVAGHVLAANPAFAELLGYQVEQLIGMKVDQFVHPADLSAGEADIANLVTGVLSTSTAHPRLIHRDGSVIRVRARKSAMQRPGSPIILVCVEDWSGEYSKVAALAWAAYHDSLTGLTNRGGLIEHLEMLCSQRVSAAVSLIDLNGFKSVNDSLGHAGGDSYLRAIADRLRTAFTPPDVVARLAGDEFVVVQQGDSADPGQLQARVTATLADEISVFDALLPVSASVGTVALADWMSPEDVLDRADRLMYADKQATRGTPARPVDRNRRWREYPGPPAAPLP